MNIKSGIFVLFMFILICSPLLAAGDVYVVMGSDTGIWDGLNVNTYVDHYGFDIYTNSNANSYRTINKSFRSKMLDSYGTPLKMTWWLMAGNTFRFASNRNVPVPNSMVCHLMKQYHGADIDSVGDELSLHYHTFVWKDYDKDGRYWWNQALNYDDFKEDFQYTLAELLLDENSFPVSFRSGWYYMDNQWQNYLENVLPFSLQNEYPSKNWDTTEPLDNDFDWSHAPSNFVPYHPSEGDYQKPGSLNGYITRGRYMANADTTFLGQIFKGAQKGPDQVICLWAHLPETDFPNNIQRIDSLLHIEASKYTNVKFRYCRATEAMQRWMKTDDSTPPNITITEEPYGEDVYYEINTDEPIFQKTPFVAIKDIYERCTILPCVPDGERRWKTSVPVKKSQAAKLAVAATDKSGNLSTKFIGYLPDDAFIDNKDAEYSEISGKWATSAASAWGSDSRSASLSPGDSAEASWRLNIKQEAKYNIFIQVPASSSPAADIEARLFAGNKLVADKKLVSSLKANSWVYLATADLGPSSANRLDIKARGTGKTQTLFFSDAVKTSALVRNKELSIEPKALDFGAVPEYDTASVSLTILNQGIEDMQVNSIESSGSLVFVSETFPIRIPSMGSRSVLVRFPAPCLGNMTDSLIIKSDDLVNPVYTVPCQASVEQPFEISDNENSSEYLEYGKWYTSNDQAYGSSSRYSWLNATPRNFALFKKRLKRSGIYEIYQIVPQAENSSDRAGYTLKINGIQKDSVCIDQRATSGKWIKLFNSFINQGDNVEVKVLDTGLKTAGDVLRADAVKFRLISETGITGTQENAPTDYMLCQNYPNPFNPSTRINYRISSGCFLSLRVYDLLGRKIATIDEGYREPGNYSKSFNAEGLAGGIYFYQLKAGEYSSVKKMILLK